MCDQEKSFHLGMLSTNTFVPKQPHFLFGCLVLLRFKPSLWFMVKPHISHIFSFMFCSQFLSLQGTLTSRFRESIILLKVEKKMDYLLAYFCEDRVASLFLLISGYFHKGIQLLHLSNYLLLEFYFLCSAHVLSCCSFSIPFNFYYLMKIYIYFWPFLLYLLSISKKIYRQKQKHSCRKCFAFKQSPL